MYSGLIAAFLTALLLTVFSVLLFRRQGPWGKTWALFLILFLSLSIVSIYVNRVGPLYLGIAWAPLVVAGLLLMLLLIAVMPGANHWRDEAIRRGETGMVTDMLPEAPSTPVGRFFWVLVILLIVAIVVGMVNPQRAM